MNYEIVENINLSGPKAKIYTILLLDEETTLFEKFINENIADYQEEIQNILVQLSTMGTTTGARGHFFKENEGKPGDGVCALYDDNSKLRLYCIRYGNIAVVLGGGGSKPKNVRAWQDDEKLSEEANLMIRISAQITQRIKDREIQFIGNQIVGNLKFEKNEE